MGYNPAQGFAATAPDVLLFLALGNLNNGSNAGLWYVNGNNALSNARWNIGSRQSG